MLRMAGPRWKEEMLAGGVRAKEGDFVQAAMRQVGRCGEARQVVSQDVVAAERADDHRTGATEVRGAAEGCQRPDIHAELWAGAFSDLDCKVRARFSFCLDCISIVKWCNGGWKLFNPCYREPLVDCMDAVAGSQALGCATRGPSIVGLHIAREHIEGRINSPDSRRMSARSMLMFHGRNSCRSVAMEVSTTSPVLVAAGRCGGVRT